MRKIRVAIDTSALRGENLSTGPITALALHGEKGLVEIFVSSVVEGEYTTKTSTKLECLAQLDKALKNLKSQAPNDLHPKIAEFGDHVRETFGRHEEGARDRFEAWKARSRAVIVPPGPDDATKVMDKYFAGTPPFGSIKARTDIPDAFIFEAIITLALKAPLFAVAADGRLSEALKSVSPPPHRGRWSSGGPAEEIAPPHCRRLAWCALETCKEAVKRKPPLFGGKGRSIGSPNTVFCKCP
jgi:hypothetical protein